MAHARARTQTSPIDAEPDFYFPPKESARRRVISNLVTAALILLTLFTVFWVFFLKGMMNSEPLASQLTLFDLIPLGNSIPGVLNGVQIVAMSMIFNSVSLKLNEYENHRTDTMFEDALIGKTFVFEFVNKYAACLYIAFIKKYYSGKKRHQCYRVRTECNAYFIILFFMHCVVYHRTIRSPRGMHR